MPQKTSLELTEIQIWPVRDPEASRVKAMASLTFNGLLRINGCRLIEGSKGIFLSYPAQKRPGTDDWISFVHPVNREASNTIQAKVIERYNALAAAD